jgi:DNA-binding NtrC family response regulator
VTDPVAAIQGQSPPMAQLRRYPPMVARSQAPVLITGETGTGKERVAEAIHRPIRRFDYSPLNLGGRFSTKALTASCRSRVMLERIS